MHFKDLSYINSDYPITYQSQQGNQEIEDIELDFFYIKVKSMSYNNGTFGGDKIIVSKILKTIDGYPNASEFSLELKKAFTTLKLTSASSSAILTSFRVCPTLSSVKRPRPRTLRNEPLSLSERVSNIENIFL